MQTIPQCLDVLKLKKKQGALKFLLIEDCSIAHKIGTTSVFNISLAV